MDLKNLLTVFSNVHFDTFPTDFSENAAYAPSSITLQCNRHQTVFINPESNDARIQPLIDKLNSMIDSYRKKAKLTLNLNRKQSIADWEYESIIPLSEADKMTKEQKLKLSQLKLPESLQKEPFGLYRYKEKIYDVSFISCSHSRGDWEVRTWECLAAQPLILGGSYKMWPAELPMRLKDIPPNGLEISQAEYSKHRNFYDLLLFSQQYDCPTGETYEYYTDGDEVGIVWLRLEKK